MVHWQETWDDHDEQVCATRVVNSWCDDNLCPICHKTFSLDHRCDPDDKRVSSKFDDVKAKLRQSPLLKMVQEAHEGPDNQWMAVSSSARTRGSRARRMIILPNPRRMKGLILLTPDDVSNDSQGAGSDAYRSANSDAESYHSDSDAPF